MAGPAEEAGEEVERVLGLAAPTAAARFVLREAVVAVFVVDGAELRVREGFVGLRDGDEAGGGGVIASAGALCQRLSGRVGEGQKNEKGEVGEGAGSWWCSITYGFLSG